MVETWNQVIQATTQDDEYTGPATELLRVATATTWGLSGHDPATLVHGLRLRRSRLLKKANEHVVSLGYQTQWPRASRTDVFNNNRYQHDGKASSTVSSLVTVLCAVGLLESAKTISDSSMLHLSDVMALQDIAMDAQQMLELASNGMPLIPSDGMTVALLAAGLVQATLCHSRQEFAATVPVFFGLLLKLNQMESVVEEGSSFLCAVADCCARAALESVFDHMQKIVQHIRHIADSLGHRSASYKLCNRIGLAAALEYADTTKHPKHLHWALDVEQAITGAHLDSTRRTPAKTPLKGQAQSKNGYRWEAGICEWVARTPAMVLRRPPSLLQRARSTQKTDNRSRTTQQEDECSSVESSPCLSSKPSSVAFPEYALHDGSAAGKTDADETAGPCTTGTCLSKKVYFSHVHIEDDGDELSTSESSQERPAHKRYRLQKMTNVTLGLKRRCAAEEQRPETYKRRGTCFGSSRSETWHCSEVCMDNQDMDLDSEDELSFL